MPIATTEIHSGDVRNALTRLQSDLKKTTPAVDFEYVDVTFPSTANSDLIIPTRLRADSPENIIYTIVGVDLLTAPTTVPIIYKDMSTTRHAWANGFIVLRSNVASLIAHLRLEVKKTNNVA